MEAIEIKPQAFILALALTLSLLGLTSSNEIGVNYGTMATKLPPPTEVVEFLKTKTIINRIKLFWPNPDVLKALADSGMPVCVTVPNKDLLSVVEPSGAEEWVKTNISPHLPQTNIIRVLVGNELLHEGPENLINSLIKAIHSVYDALQKAGHTDIKVSSSHSLDILAKSEWPSGGKFKEGWDKSIFEPLLKFLKETKSPFMVNPFTYYTTKEKLNWCTFGEHEDVQDPESKVSYTNEFDWHMDTVYMALKSMGYEDLEIVIGETGWPTIGDEFHNPENAKSYNSRMIEHVNSGKGTPLMPGKKFEAYIFCLFNEDEMPGTVRDKNFGLFYPDFKPVYDAGIMK